MFFDKSMYAVTHIYLNQTYRAHVTSTDTMSYSNEIHVY